MAQRNNYKKEINVLKQKISSLKSRNTKGNKIVEDIKFAVRALIKFKQGDSEVRKSIMRRLGSNRTLEDRILLIQPHKWLLSLDELIKPLESKFLTLELEKKPVNTKQNEACASLCCELRGVVKLIITWFQELDKYYYVPKIGEC